MGGGAFCKLSKGYFSCCIWQGISFSSTVTILKAFILKLLNQNKPRVAIANTHKSCLTVAPWFTGLLLNFNNFRAIHFTRRLNWNHQLNHGLLHTKVAPNYFDVVHWPTLYYFVVALNSCKHLEHYGIKWHALRKKGSVETVQRSWSYFSVHISTSREKLSLPAMSRMWGAQWKGEVKDDSFFPMKCWYLRTMHFSAPLWAISTNGSKSQLENPKPLVTAERIHFRPLQIARGFDFVSDMVKVCWCTASVGWRKTYTKSFIRIASVSITQEGWMYVTQVDSQSYMWC